MYKLVVFIAIIVLGIAGYFLMSSNAPKKFAGSTLIFTQVPAGEVLRQPGSQIIIPDYKNSRIVSMNYMKVDEGVANLTPDFYAACSPSLSFDNNSIVFAGKKAEGDPWQIWTMSIKGSGLKRVTNTQDNCLTPAFLPDGLIVFSREKNDERTGTGYALFTCKADGSEIYQITFHPHNDLYPSVLHDGRISMISQQVYPDIKEPVFMVLRPDGTQCQSFFYQNDQPFLKGRVCETNDKYLIFNEREGEMDKLLARAYANPIKKYSSLIVKPANRIHSVDILDSGRYVFSCQTLKNGVYSLYTINGQNEEELIYMNENYHSIEPIAVRNKELPRKLPSTVSQDKGKGKLVCQNVNQSNIKIEGDQKTRYIRVLGVDKMLNEFELADDGSFYLMVESDLPIRFQSLNEQGEVLRGPSSWIWLRSNERRACVGCHEKREIAPDNLVPQAINSPPVWVTDSSGYQSSQNIVWKKEKGGDHEN